MKALEKTNAVITGGSLPNNYPKNILVDLVAMARKATSRSHWTLPVNIFCLLWKPTRM